MPPGFTAPVGAGCAEELGVSDAIEIQMGTLGKALGASGGYICGSRALIDYLINRARSFHLLHRAGPGCCRGRHGRHPLRPVPRGRGAAQHPLGACQRTLRGPRAFWSAGATGARAYAPRPSVLANA